MKIFTPAVFLALACLSLADESPGTGYPHANYAHGQPMQNDFAANLNAVAANTQASQGISNIYALISSLVIGLGVIAREFLNRKTFRKSEELNEELGKCMAGIDRKFEKLFGYSDEGRTKDAELHGRVSTLEQQVRSIDVMQTDIKEMTKEMKQIQLNIERLVTLQEAYLKTKGSRNG